jgi:hypothetical protein
LKTTSRARFEEKLKAQAAGYKEFKGKSKDEVKEMLIEKETAKLIGEVQKQQAEWDSTQDAQEKKKKKKQKKTQDEEDNPLADELRTRSS